jgi:hypothetical protein
MPSTSTRRAGITVVLLAEINDTALPAGPSSPSARMHGATAPRG